MTVHDYLTLGQTLSPHDLIAVAFFRALWSGYARFATWYGRRVPSLQGVLDGIRHTWAQRMVERDNRMVDINIVRNLTRPTHDQMLNDQLAQATAARGAGDLKKLLNTGETWTVE